MDIYLIDGSSYVYRAYFAIKGLSTSKGLPTNAIYGFTNMLLKILNDKKPDGIAIVFDRPEPTRRHKVFEEYKAQRPKAPDDMIIQLPYIRRTIEALGIKVIELPGYEADDILASMALKLAQKNKEVYIVSGDKDILQIINHGIKMFDPMKNIVYDSQRVLKKYGIHSQRISEFMALTGDVIDNIPGIKGVGEKTALEILSYGSLEEIIKNPDLIKKERLRNLIKKNLETLKLSYELAKIDRDVPISVTPEDLHRKEPVWNELFKIFSECEFASLLKMLPSSPLEFKIVMIKPHLAQWRGNSLPHHLQLKAITLKTGFAYDLVTKATAPTVTSPPGTVTSPLGTVTSPLGDAGGEIPLGISIVLAGSEIIPAYLPPPNTSHPIVYFIPFEKPIVTSPLGEDIEFIRQVFEDEAVIVIGHNIKKDIRIFKRIRININAKLEDVGIASYLINPLKSNYELEDLSIEYLGIKIGATVTSALATTTSASPVTSPAENLLFQKSSALDESTTILSGFENYNSYLVTDNYYFTAKSATMLPLVERSARNTICKLKLWEFFKRRLSEEGLEYLYNEIEIPLVRVLADMEDAGVKVDVGLLKGLLEDLFKELEALKSRIYLIAGEEFNINSPKQLSHILFDKLGLKPKKRTKTGYSTQWSVLEELAFEHELPREIITYRNLFKLKTTYVDVLLSSVNPFTGRLHTSFHQTATATGRLSSSEPNLQNIPVKGIWADRIRQVFIVDEGNVMLFADYSQIELRILANMCKDKVFVEAFRKGLDIHAVTAGELFGIEPGQVTPDMRRVAKTVNFGIIYGMSAFGLSETLGIQREEAQAYIDLFFTRHPAIKEISLDLIKKAEVRGYAETLFGRKRPIPELKSTNPSTRALGERLAINSPLQGTASDIMKLAMIRIWNKLKAQQVKTKMLLQIHDELVFEVPLEEIGYVNELIRHEMEHVVELEVPLIVNIATGKNMAKI